MITLKSQFRQHVVAGITLILVLGALSTIWPAIIAVFLSIILLLQSFSAESEIARLSWAKMGDLSVVIDLLRHPDFPVVFS